MGNTRRTITRKVVKGDTLTGISRETGIPVESLMKWSGIRDPRSLKVGQDVAVVEPYPGRLNNPGNLRYHRGWDGAVTKGLKTGDFLRFRDPRDGLNAAATNVARIARILGPQFSVENWANKYAPPSENDTARYAKDISAAIGVEPGTALDLGNADQMSRLMKAVVQMESGKAHANWFTDDEYREAAGLMKSAGTRQDAGGGETRAAMAGGETGGRPSSEAKRERLADEANERARLRARDREEFEKFMAESGAGPWGTNDDYWRLKNSGFPVDDMIGINSLTPDIAGAILLDRPTGLAVRAVGKTVAPVARATASVLKSGAELGVKAGQRAIDGYVKWTDGSIANKKLELLKKMCERYGVKKPSPPVAQSRVQTPEPTAQSRVQTPEPAAQGQAKTPEPAAQGPAAQNMSGRAEQGGKPAVERKGIDLANAKPFHGSGPATKGPAVSTTRSTASMSQAELDELIKAGDPNVIQWGKNVDNLLGVVPPKESFPTTVRTGSMPEFDNVEMSRLLDDVGSRFGPLAREQTENLFSDPRFARMMYPDGYAKRAAEYRDLKSVYNLVTEPNEVVLAGSPGISSEGSIYRSKAAPHDLDFCTNVSGASRKPVSELTAEDQISRLTDTKSIEDSRVFELLRERVPELRNAKFRHAKTDYEFDRGPNGEYNPDSRYDSRYFTVPMAKPSLSADGRATMLVTTRINGKKIDIFLQDAKLGVSSTNPRMGSAETAMNAKRAYTSHGAPREKDLPDLTGFEEYGESNLMVDPFSGQSQFASFMFPEKTYIAENGLPVIAEMPIRPSHDLKVPVIMNDRGEFLQLTNPEPVLNWYSDSHPMYRFPGTKATEKTHPLVAVSGSAGQSPWGIESPSVGTYAANDLDLMVEDMLTGRPGNWVTYPNGKHKDVLVFPRAMVDPRHNPRTVTWHQDAWTRGVYPNKKASAKGEINQSARDWGIQGTQGGNIYGSPDKGNFPELNSAYRLNIYANNPRGHFSGAEQLPIYHGYGESKTADLIPKDNYVKIPGSLLDSDRDKAKAVLRAVLERMKFAVPVSVSAGAGAYGLASDEAHQDAKGGETRQDAKGGETRADSRGGDAAVPQGGQAAPAGGPRIVINPSTFRNKKDALCVAFNERFRIAMEEYGFEPKSKPTDAQRKFFADTAYADDEVQLRRTILARILTLDTSIS